MLHENLTLGKRLRGEENLLHEKCRKDWKRVALRVEGGVEQNLYFIKLSIASDPFF